MINGELLLTVPIDKNHKTQKYKTPTSHLNDSIDCPHGVLSHVDGNSYNEK